MIFRVELICLCSSWWSVVGSWCIQTTQHP